MNTFFEPYRFHSSRFNEAGEDAHFPEEITIFDSTIRKILFTPGARPTIPELTNLAKISYDAGLVATILNVHWWGSKTPEPFGLEVARQVIPHTGARITISTDVFNTEDWRKALPIFAELQPQAISLDLAIPDAPELRGERDRMLERAREVADVLRTYGIEPIFGVLDFGRMDRSTLDAYLAAGVESQVEAFLLHDSSSALSAEGIKAAVAYVRERADDIQLIMHAHNDCGLADGNALAAVSAGAHPDVSACGVSYRGGFAKLEVIAAALDSLYGQTVELDWRLIQRMCRTVAELVPLNELRGVTGSRAFLKEFPGVYMKYYEAEGDLETAPDSVLVAKGFGGKNHFVWARNMIASDAVIEMKLRSLSQEHAEVDILRARELLIHAFESKPEYPYWLEDSEVDNILR